MFSDDLLQWCEAGWDYIGAPWLPCRDSEWVKEPAVGNGGFTLMKVESCLRVLYNRYREEPLSYVADVVTFNGRYLGPLFRLLENLRRIFPRSRVSDGRCSAGSRAKNPVQLVSTMTSSGRSTLAVTCRITRWQQSRMR